jgi:hypothetical protein
MTMLSSTVGLWSGLSWLPTVVGVSSWTFYILNCIDEGSVYINVTWVHAGQNHVHSQGTRVHSSKQSFGKILPFFCEPLTLPEDVVWGFFRCSSCAYLFFLNGIAGVGVQ